MLLASVPREKRLFKDNPPGTARITDSFYVDRTPIRVIDYLEFLSAIRNSYSPKMRDTIKTLPKWGLNKDILEELQNHFEWDSIYYDRMLTRSWTYYANDEKTYDIDFRIMNPQYYYYPLVNVDYMQVNEYCKWRTDMVKIHYAVISTTEKQRRRYPMNLKYRLAKKSEWEQLLGDFLGQVETLNNNADKYEKMMDNISSPYENNYSFNYSSKNVAEMLEGFKITTGFVWDEKYEMGAINYIQFNEPTDWIGFRCVCEVLPEKVKKVEVKILRDKFGKIIEEKKPEVKKVEEPTPEVEVKKKTKTKSVKSKKSKKIKKQTQSMRTKHRKYGKK
jgi:hypothetical protein